MSLVRPESVPVHPSSRRWLVGLVTAAVLAAACVGRPGASTPDGSTSEASSADSQVGAATITACCGDSAMGVALRIAADYRESALSTRAYSSEQFWAAVLPVVEYAGFPVRALAGLRSDASLRAITIGRGPDTVLVWSRAAHGGSTGTMAMADIFRWFANTRAEDRDDALRARLLEGVTLVFVPLLPPSSGTAVPPADPLAVALREQLHARVAVGLLERDEASIAGRTPSRTSGSGSAASVAIPREPAVVALAPPGDADARLVAATLATSLLTELPGRLVRVLPTAVGASPNSGTVLVVSGALPNDPQQQRLRAVHVAVLLSLFDGVATGAYRTVDPAVFTRLPDTP